MGKTVEEIKKGLRKEILVDLNLHRKIEITSKEYKEKKNDNTRTVADESGNYYEYKFEPINNDELEELLKLKREARAVKDSNNLASIKKMVTVWSVVGGICLIVFALYLIMLVTGQIR